MKVFLSRVGVFTCLLIALILGALYVNATIMSNDLQDKISDIKTIFLGDSHGQNGINPDFYTAEKSANFSASGEGYHFSYIKLKGVLSKNNSLQKVVLTLSSHNLSKEIDPLWIYNSNNFQEKSATYYPFMTGADFVRFQKNNLLIFSGT